MLSPDPRQNRRCRAGNLLIGLPELPEPPLAMVVLAGVASVTLACALWFPNRPEELLPELWKATTGVLPAE